MFTRVKIYIQSHVDSFLAKVKIRLTYIFFHQEVDTFLAERKKKKAFIYAAYYRSIIFYNMRVILK